MEVNSGTDAAVAPAGLPRRRTQAQRTAATRAQLLNAARALFADRGFANVTTEAIVTAAGVTRGALYHQFGNKAALFAAVHEQVQRDLVADVAKRIAVASPADAMEGMRVGARLFLELCAAPEVQQISLIDAPAVLGWEQWRGVGMQHGLGIITAMLAQAIADDAIPEQPVPPSAHVLLGALDEAALYISRASDPEKAREEMGHVCDRLINGIADRRW
jgi:AcrR family transcriptional regulator